MLSSRIPRILDPKAGQELASRYHSIPTSLDIPGQFTVEELSDLGYLEYANARPNDLTSPIHPMLDLGKWRLAPIAENSKPLDAENAKLLEPILRLASAMLLSPGSVVFLHNVMYRRRKHEEEASNKYNRKLHTLPEPLKPFARMRTEFDEVISHIGPNVHIYLADHSDPEWKELKCTGRCHCLAQSRILYPKTIRPLAVKRGRSSAIRIDDACLVLIRILQQKEQTLQDVNRTLRIQFRMALTICHELSHAINIAVAKTRNEPYYGYQDINELGFAWQEYVFDGLVHSVDPDYRWSMGLFHFPEPRHYVSKYGRHRRGNGPPRSHTFYWVSMKWISRLHRQSAWVRWSGSLDPKLLHIPRSIGVQLISPSIVEMEAIIARKARGTYSRQPDGVLDRGFQWDTALFESDETAIQEKPGRIHRSGRQDGNDVSEDDLEGYQQPERVRSSQDLDAEIECFSGGITGLLSNLNIEPGSEKDDNRGPDSHGRNADQGPDLGDLDMADNLTGSKGLFIKLEDDDVPIKIEHDSEDEVDDTLWRRQGHR